MRSFPPLRFADLSGARVGLWGLGVEGRASLRRLAALGVTPVLVADEPTGEGGVVATAAGGLELLRVCDVVVKSPGVSRYRPEVLELEASGVAVVGGLGLWLEEVDRSRVVLITGTKGKSTTASITAHLLAGLGLRARVAGNLGTPPWDGEATDDNADVIVVEASSFQITDLWHAPPVVALTSLSADHLDWHGDAERYFADKLSVCRLPGADVTVANGDDARLRARATALGDRVDWVGASEATAASWADGLGLIGAHNRINAVVARHVLLAAGVVGADDDERLARAAAGFSPLPSRLTPVRRLKEVDFVDDGLATNTLPTIAALEAFRERRVALLVGGFDRGIDYAPLADALASRTEATLVIGLPDNGGRILEHVLAADGGDGLACVAAGDLEEGIRIGFSWSRPGGVVLLSPAAPSFGHFVDYRDRSASFVRIVRSLR